MDWGTAAVTLMAAVVAAVFGFAGGYYGARLQVRGNLEQWQRNHLLGFSSDLVAAAHEGDDYTTGVVLGQSPTFPSEALVRMRRAFAGLL